MLNYDRLSEIAARRPLLHCVSNIVTANDCANLALAVGASPMMAEAPEEMAEITALSDATVLNTGTPSEEKFRACRICGEESSKSGKPVVLDPVGVGAGSWRLQWVGRLLDACSPTILRVNLGEARALLRFDGGEHGVDSVAEADASERLALAAALSERYRAAVLLSGPEDIVTDGRSARRITGGSGRVAKVTGAGCMLSVLCGAFAAVEPDAASAAALASVFWKVCSRLAEARSGVLGTASFRAALIDAASTLDASSFAKEAANGVEIDQT